MVVSALASCTGGKFLNALVPLMSVLSSTFCLLCWLLYGGWADDVLCGQVNNFHASFWIQVGASCLAVIATLIVILLHLAVGGFGMKPKVVTGVVPMHGTPAKEPAGQLVISNEVSP
eukprot:NODE_10044_length_612_cov_77.204499_g9770_i0.p1 GENE.NODE_10044_length_612_cov_77.204499_g9770_i0~~NODE_10044_length_612_cov_77.204499_g9770_i0.p1  ORF type:complete len:137 (+),score=35.02 NODE_10044_length_612_cov_77.204499_g9770_i0:63-413(+)